MFAFSLAVRLGRFVDEILDEMSADEFADWFAYLSLTPDDLPKPSIEEQFRQALGEKNGRKSR